MLGRLQVKSGAFVVSRAGLGPRALAISLAAALLIVLLAFAGARAVWADDEPGCEATDLGTLGADVDSLLQAEGRWTTEDCDSHFRIDSDAHGYRFEVVEGGRIRIGLSSAGADPYLYLLAEDGSRIADNDDGGDNLDARVERDLAPGVYLVEATTTGGRVRGAADFTLTVSRVAGCETVHLGDLEAGEDLTASGSWSLDTCGSRFVMTHPAHSYSFTLPAAGRVRIDLTSENGDPVLSLLSASQGLIGANDDGGEFRNSRIDRYLTADTYVIEATTYLERDLQPLEADFDLVVHLVDEEERQRSFQIKIEDTHTPDLVVAGEPFPVHYRVGNLGGGGLADGGGSIVIYVVGPRVFDRTRLIIPAAGAWEAGVSYHSGAPTAGGSSVTNGDVEPFEATFSRPGPAWLFVGVVAYNEFDEEIGFHGIWRNLMVLSAAAFGPSRVMVNGLEYRVSALPDHDGMVTTSVTSLTDPAADIDPGVRAKAIYTAGVVTQTLDGIFQRPVIADLPVVPVPASVNLVSPSSTTLLTVFADQYSTAIAASGLSANLDAGEAINPLDVETLVLDAAATAAARYASQAAHWRTLLERAGMERPVSFAEAVVVQSQLAYAERLASPAVTAGQIVHAARAAADGWDDRGVQAMVSDLASQAFCIGSPGAPGAALEGAGVEDVEGLLTLDAELRAALPVYGLANDSALCAAAAVDEDISRFLRTLSIADDAELRRLLGPTPPPEPAPEPLRLRILARLADEGRVEHALELASGEQVLPEVRFLSADAAVGVWQHSSDVEVDGEAVGQIRTRHLADGRVEVGFQTAGGEEIAPEVRYLPADPPEGVWFRSGAFEAPAAAP